MDGTISVESEYGKGSTFYFTAWFGVGSDESDRKRFIPDIAGLHALVVDDNAQAREILTDSLRSLHCGQMLCPRVRTRSGSWCRRTPRTRTS